MYYALVDVHSMYSSAESSFRPDLAGKPVAVASNGDGMIIALNSAAKKIGVSKFATVASQRNFFDSGACALFSSNYTLYQELSHRLSLCLEKQQIFTNIANYSIDELFGELPACVSKYDDLLQCSQQLRRAAWDQVRLPVGVGMGRTLSLAKCASHIGKRGKGYRGIAVMIPENESYLLSQIDVASIWNVGPSTAALLKRKSIQTALDLRRVPPKDAKKLMGINLERIVRELRGENVYSMDSFPDASTRQEVSSSLSLTRRAKTKTELHQALSDRISVAAEKLRRQGFVAKHMVLFAQSDRFKQDYQSFFSNISFQYPTDDTRNFISALSLHFGELYKAGVEYYKIGCRITGLQSKDFLQQDLFAPTQSSELMAVMDGLNKKMGYRAVGIGSQKVNSDAAMLRKHLSPSYLTEWKDLPRIKC